MAGVRAEWLLLKLGHTLSAGASPARTVPAKEAVAGSPMITGLLGGPDSSKLLDLRTGESRHLQSASSLTGLLLLLALSLRLVSGTSDAAAQSALCERLPARNKEERTPIQLRRG